MDKILKALSKLTPDERKKIKILLQKIKTNNLADCDIVKLKGENSIYRIRSGKIRIIFIKDKTSIRLLTIERRSDTTYNL
ncbi:TPA: type II toxin-antitoxin system mRNA interferase toxin, RelE/StbE family [Candidatus Falkowbacteria bacterium]|nr:type II toxin-antitoxin system mRNA interferase toxin, RelE/StbE family [Candidatus Falkowbacteria bacterium]